jgi:hypothetical protein
MKKTSIHVGLLGSFAGAVLLLVSCMCPVVSHVPVPGSSMTAVVTADLAGCYDVQLYEQGHPIPGERQCLGPYASQHCSLSQVSTRSNVVTISWTDGGDHYNTAVDVDARRFVAYPAAPMPVRLKGFCRLTLSWCQPASCPLFVLERRRMARLFRKSGFPLRAEGGSALVGLFTTQMNYDWRT